MQFKPESIRRLREGVGMSVEAFSKKLGCHRNLVYDWESGKVKPSIASLESIMNTFGIENANLFFCQTTNEHVRKTENYHLTQPQ